MSLDSDEEYQQSWMSVKGLQQAADMRAVFRFREEARPGSPSSLNSSVSTETTPNQEIHASPSFSGMREGRAEDIHQHRGSVHQLTSRFTHELVELRLELTRAQHEITRLNLEIARIQREQKLELQQIFAHQERKIKKIRLEAEIESGSEREERKLRQELAAVRKQLENERNEYEERLETMRMEQELELQANEEACERGLQQEIAAVEEQYKAQIDQIGLRHKAEIRQFCSGEREISRFRRVPKELIEERPLPSSPKASHSFEARETLIEAQITQIESLKSQLAAALRKQPIDTLRSSVPCQIETNGDLSTSQNLEAELKQLINQIE